MRLVVFLAGLPNLWGTSDFGLQIPDLVGSSMQFGEKKGQVITIPVKNGEGRFVADEPTLDALASLAATVITGIVTDAELSSSVRVT